MRRATRPKLPGARVSPASARPGIVHTDEAGRASPDLTAVKTVNSKPSFVPLHSGELGDQRIDAGPGQPGRGDHFLQFQQSHRLALPTPHAGARGSNRVTTWGRPTASANRTMQHPAGGTPAADSVGQGGRNGPGTGSIKFRRGCRAPLPTPSAPSTQPARSSTRSERGIPRLAGPRSRDFGRRREGEAPAAARATRCRRIEPVPRTDRLGCSPVAVSGVVRVRAKATSWKCL